MTELNEIKAKYPLAVEFIKGKEFTSKTDDDILMFTTIEGCELGSVDCFVGIDILTNEPLNNSPVQDEIGKMIAELLNLIAKP